MKRTCFYPPLATASAVFALLLSLAPAGAGAAEIIVPGDYAHIQEAITAAKAGDTIVVEPGNYPETITLKDGVVVHGRETARTFLNGGGSGPIVTVSSSVSSTIGNFTFINASTAILVSNSTSTLTITNNVFEVGAAGAAITVQNAARTRVVNNVFYGNGTAVTRDADIEIINNVFMNNSTALADTSLLSVNTRYNDFFNNTSSGPMGTNSVTADPLFVDPANHDFHLRSGSPCIDTGDATVGNDIVNNSHCDIGAYGGSAADTFPFPVAGLTITSTTDTSIGLSWSPNYFYLLGGYKILYGYALGAYIGTDAGGGSLPSPVSAGTNTSFTLSNLTPVWDTVAPAGPI